MRWSVVGRCLTWLHPPWFDSVMTDLWAAYFRSQGFDVVASMSVDLNIAPQRADPDELASWIARHVPDTAQALFISGNGFRVASIIDRLEREVGCSPTIGCCSGTCSGA